MALAGLAALLLSAHPLHTASADLHISRTGFVAELRVFRDDLELELGRRLDAKGVGPWAHRTFGMVCDGRPVRLTYARHHIAGDMVRIELRGAPASSTACRVRFEAFFGRFDDQVNLVRVRAGRGGRTLVFVPGDGWKAVV